jgi:general secretion pathway protein D
VIDGRATIDTGSGTGGGNNQGNQGNRGNQNNQNSQGNNQNFQGNQGNQNFQGNQGNQNTPTPSLDERLKELTSVLDKLNGDGKGGSLANALTGNADDSQDLIDSSIRHQAAIYVGVIKPQNRVIVRTRDRDAMIEIKKIAKHLDVQSSMLLMEVKVLSIDLLDGYDSLFDFRIKSGDFTVSSFSGIGGFDNLVTNAGAAFSPALLAKVVSNNFEARLQLLEKEGRVTSLATPLLLTSNQEVSRFFIGEEIPILTGYTAGSATTGSVITIIRPLNNQRLNIPNTGSVKPCCLRPISMPIIRSVYKYWWSNQMSIKMVQPYWFPRRL